MERKIRQNNTEVLFHLRGNLKQMRWGSVSTVNQIKMKCNSSLGAAHVDSFFFFLCVVVFTWGILYCIRTIYMGCPSQGGQRAQRPLLIDRDRKEEDSLEDS